MLQRGNVFEHGGIAVAQQREADAAPALLVVRLQQREQFSAVAHIVCGYVRNVYSVTAKLWVGVEAGCESDSKGRGQAVQAQRGVHLRQTERFAGQVFLHVHDPVISVLLYAAHGAGAGGFGRLVRIHGAGDALWRIRGNPQGERFRIPNRRTPTPWPKLTARGAPAISCKTRFLLPR